jgi:hypothetical protein
VSDTRGSTGKFICVHPEVKEHQLTNPPSIKDHAASTVSDEKFADRASRWSLDTPDTKEAYLIREIFESHFPTDAAAKTAVRWIP